MIFKNLPISVKEKAPKWLEDSIQYETIMGSYAYNVSSDLSDLDIYGLCIPPRNIVFPHKAGYIMGFGKQFNRFRNFQQHHIEISEILDFKNIESVDVSYYNIIDYFQLCMENNPNMIDSLFTPENCVVFESEIMQKIRKERRVFLHSGLFYKFSGYAYAQMKKMKNIKKLESKRADIIKIHGYDIKNAYHLVRLVLETEDFLKYHDADLTKNSEILKSVRAGEWELEEVENWFFEKEKEMKKLYNQSTLPKYPNEKGIKKLLVECLEMFYGKKYV